MSGHWTDPSWDEAPVTPPAPGKRTKGRHGRAPADKPGVWAWVTMVSLAVIAVLLLLGVRRVAEWEQFRRLMAQDRAETLAEGLRIGDTPVGGLTRAQAMALLNTQPAQAQPPLRLRIRADDLEWVLTQDDLSTPADSGAMVSEAWSASRRLTLRRGEIVDTPLAARERLRDSIRTEGLQVTAHSGNLLEDIARYVDGLAAAVDRAPVNAALSAVDFSRRDFQFTEDIPGRTLDRTALVSAIAVALDAGEDVVEAQVRQVPAGLTRLRLKNTFGCLEIRSFDTQTSAGDDQVRAMTEALNGAIIPGGETLSLRGLMNGRVTGLEQANADRFASALFDAGLCAGMRLVERAALDTAAARGLEAHVDDTADLKLNNASESPMCVLCYYTPLNSRGTRGAVTLEVYGLLRPAGETAALSVETVETVRAGAPEYTVNPDLAPGTTLLRREARDGETVRTLLQKMNNGRVYATEVVCVWTYPPVSRLIERGP